MAVCQAFIPEAFFHDDMYLQEINAVEQTPCCILSRPCMFVASCDLFHLNMSYADWAEQWRFPALPREED